MPEEYFDVAYINDDKAIMHGRAKISHPADWVVAFADVEQVLTSNQVLKIEAMKEAHQTEMDRLLASFLDRSALVERKSDV